MLRICGIVLPFLRLVNAISEGLIAIKAVQTASMIPICQTSAKKCLVVAAVREVPDVTGQKMATGMRHRPVSWYAFHGQQGTTRAWITAILRSCIVRSRSCADPTRFYRTLAVPYVRRNGEFGHE